MFPTTVKPFVHPHSAYRLEYPAHWDQVIEKDGESCGFGPHERDDIGLWISILPMSVDTTRMVDDLPKVMEQAVEETEAVNMRKDGTLRHYGLIADMTKEGDGGNYWIVAGGDLILFASTQVPPSERDVWNPHFFKLMASLQITRDDHLFARQVYGEVMQRLKEKHPEQEFKFEGNKIKGPNQVVYLGNVLREVKAMPKNREKIIAHFVDTVAQPANADLGQEAWEEVRGCIVPILKPRAYIEHNGPAKHFLLTEWLSDVVICYAIHRKKMFRFVTEWDVNRWGIAADTLREQALQNLTALPWPKKLLGSAEQRGEGKLILVQTDDNLAASRLLHPQLHGLFKSAFGTTFWAGVPSRDLLVLFSDRKEMKQRIGRRIKKDYVASSYQITPQTFLVTADGIAPGPKVK